MNTKYTVQYTTTPGGRVWTGFSYDTIGEAERHRGALLRLGAANAWVTKPAFASMAAALAHAPEKGERI